MNLSEIVCQDKAIGTLRAYAAGRIPHAYLFSGKTVSANSPAPVPGPRYSVKTKSSAFGQTPFFSCGTCDSADCLKAADTIFSRSIKNCTFTKKVKTDNSS